MLIKKLPSWKQEKSNVDRCNSMEVAAIVQSCVSLIKNYHELTLACRDIINLLYVRVV